MATATSQVYDPDIRVPGLRPGQEAACGETMRVISASGFGGTAAVALLAAVEALLFQLTAKGYSKNHDVTMIPGEHLVTPRPK
jgi:hypothetical protein